MRVAEWRNSTWVASLAVLSCLAMTAASHAQSAADGSAPQSTSDSNTEPQTAQSRLARIKREQRREEPTGERAPVRDGDHQFELRVKNYIQLREQNIVMQRRDYSCGAATLATIGRYYWGDDVTEDMFLEALDNLLTDEEIQDRLENGLAMSDLRRAAVKVGYKAVVGRLTYEKLTGSKVPLIVGIEPEGHKHFVVYRGSHNDLVYMADPIRGNVRMPAADFRDQWQQNAVLVIHKPGEKVRKTSPLSLTDADTRRGEELRHLIQTQPTRLPRHKQTVPP